MGEYLFYDSFGKPDSTVDLAKGETNLNPWEYASAGTATTTWGIQDRQAYVVSTTSVGTRSVAVQEVYEADCVVEVNLKTLGVGVGLVLRYKDIDNFIGCNISSTYLSLYKRVNGVYTLIKDFSPTTELGKQFGDCKLSVVLKGGRIEVYVDGYIMMKRWDTFNKDYTKHGIFSTGESLNTRWDNFCIRKGSEVPFSIKENFETNLSSWYWSKESAEQSYSQTFDTTIKKSGSKSLRMELRKTDPDVSGSKRCEITLRPEEPLEEHWYGVSIYLPASGDDEYTADPADEILIQWHNTPDGGEEWTSPPIALYTRNDKYLISQRWDEGRYSTNAIMAQNGTALMTEIGSFTNDKGKWVDWMFHIKWGWNEDQNPITEVYKDGVLVYENNGVPNVTNDRFGVYPKLGIYKWTWKIADSGSTTTKRVVYYDNYFIK